jgi:MerR family gold-responsive transcriptional activator of gol and ges genes
MLIGDAANRAGVNPQTLRYYERRGLIPAAGRRDSGYREYTADQVRVVRFVKRAQELGFSLNEISELLKLRNATAPKPAVRDLGERRLADLDQRIEDLIKVRDALQALVGACRKGHRPVCPILEALEDEGERRT